MALKSLFAAGLVAAVLALLPGAAPAEAKTRVVIGIGLPGPVYSCGHFRRNCAVRVRPRYIAPRAAVLYRAPVRARLSCSAALRVVGFGGFFSVRTHGCRGDYYSFIGHRHGHPYRIKVNAITGRIVGKVRL